MTLLMWNCPSFSPTYVATVQRRLDYKSMMVSDLREMEQLDSQTPCVPSWKSGLVNGFTNLGWNVWKAQLLNSILLWVCRNAIFFHASWLKCSGYLIAPACCWDSPQSCAMSASKCIYQTLSLWFYQLGAHVEGLGMRLGMRVLREPSWPLTKQQSQLQMWLQHNIYGSESPRISPSQVALSWYQTSSTCLRVGSTVKRMSGGWWETVQSSGLPSGSMLRLDSCRSEPTRATPYRFGSCYLATTILRPCRYEAGSRPPCSVVLQANWDAAIVMVTAFHRVH